MIYAWRRKEQGSAADRYRNEADRRPVGQAGTERAYKLHRQARSENATPSLSPTEAFIDGPSACLTQQTRWAARIRSASLCFVTGEVSEAKAKAATANSCCSIQKSDERRLEFPHLGQVVLGMHFFRPPPGADIASNTSKGIYTLR